MSETPEGHQMVAPEVMISLIGRNEMSEVPAAIGDDRRVVALGRTLLAGVTPEMAAQWIDVLTPIADSAPRSLDADKREDERVNIILALKEHARFAEGRDQYSQGRVSGLLKAVKIVSERHKHS